MAPTRRARSIACCATATVAIGQGAHTDIIMMSALAYLAAVNKLEYLRTYRPVDSRTDPEV